MPYQCCTAMIPISRGASSTIPRLGRQSMQGTHQLVPVQRPDQICTACRFRLERRRPLPPTFCNSQRNACRKHVLSGGAPWHGRKPPLARWRSLPRAQTCADGPISPPLRKGPTPGRDTPRDASFPPLASSQEKAWLRDKLS